MELKKILHHDMSRRITAIILGIVFSIVISSIAIALGYTHVRTNNLSGYTVELLGLPIFTIVKIGDEMGGSPNISVMMFLGLMSSMVLALLVEVLVARRKKRK
jgi:uncharacterized PurR-regulated membrane protein YhhQ (DUF165 family)